MGRSSGEALRDLTNLLFGELLRLLDSADELDLEELVLSDRVLRFFEIVLGSMSCSKISSRRLVIASSKLLFSASSFSISLRL